MLDGRKVFVLGGAQTDFARNWKKEGKNVVALLSEVFNDAMNAIGLEEDDINSLKKDNRIACYMGNFIAESYKKFNINNSFNQWKIFWKNKL